MKHLAPIRMFGPGKGDFKSADPDHPDSRDFRAEVEKLDDDDPETTEPDQDPPGTENPDAINGEKTTSDSTGGTAQGPLSAVPKD